MEQHCHRRFPPGVAQAPGEFPKSGQPEMSDIPVDFAFAVVVHHRFQVEHVFEHLKIGFRHFFAVGNLGHIVAHTKIA